MSDPGRGVEGGNLANADRRSGVATNGILPLEPGDRLTRAEFERRYHAMPQVKKAELIEGVVQMSSPVRLNRHGQPHAYFVMWMAMYAGRTPGVGVADNTSDRLDLDNEPQPDAMLFVLPECGGQITVTDDDYVGGAAELVGEVASSRASCDLGVKCNVYRHNGVKEYIVWRVLDQAIDWFVLRDDDYVRLQPGDDGILRSEIFPGLWLDPAAIIGGDIPRLDEVLRDGLASSEHDRFAARLGAVAKGEH